MKDADCVQFLQWALPQLGMRWPGFRKVRRQVCKRVERRMRHLALENVTAYRDYLGVHAGEWSELDELCRISISRFYRDRGVFDLLRDIVLPLLAAAALDRGDGVVRAWSAGCASGEEPYTLTAIWEIGVKPQYPNINLQVTATDADPHLLERAQRGCYRDSSLKDFPPAWRTDVFSELGEQFCVRDRFRTAIEFVQQDIRREQPAGSFDMILCRHLVFTYFDRERQEDCLKRMLARLRPSGMLVIGKQEEFSVAENQLAEFVPHSGVYRRTLPPSKEVHST